MEKPNYMDGSIVNLMSSISTSLGDRPAYRPLKNLKPGELAKSKNIVLLVIDGLGYEYVKRNGEGSVFGKHLMAKITSVFPSTTATAVTTFLTGVAPQQHAITGWFVYLKEVGAVATILPFVTRCGNLSLDHAIDRKKIFNQQGVEDRIDADFFMVMPKNIVSSDSKKGKKTILSYNTMGMLFRRTKEAIKSGKRKKLIYAYWPEFDTICHHHGTKSAEALKHFRHINAGLKAFLKSVEGTNTTVIITSDHGQIDAGKSSRIILKKHPVLAETLILPLSGDARNVYCYVRPSKTKQFEAYVRKNLKGKCELHKSGELVRKGYFGLFKPNKKLSDRIGDYVLIMKGSYILQDFLPEEEESFNIGNHGGLSKEEILVPLVVVRS